MTELSNINLEFLSNENLINILRSVLNEVDSVASHNAYRTTTYLAVSTIEGIFRELIRLFGLNSNNVPTWPKKQDKTTPKREKDLTLKDMTQILSNEGKLPVTFADLYDRIRDYRNYMHPSAELEKMTPIDQSVAQLSVACLTALLEQYSPVRFVANYQWRLEVGNAHPHSKDSFDIQHSGEYFALLVSELPAKNFTQIKFVVNIPSERIFNLVYNYSSKNRFMAARIDKRISSDPNWYPGLLKCVDWRKWDIIDHYTEDSEPNFQLQEHTIQVTLSSSHSFAIVVDDVPLALKGGTPWGFDPELKIGFMSEVGMVTVKDVTVQ